jgi:5-(carboxyamino)imidazole ribonucleotide synthase
VTRVGIIGAGQLGLMLGQAGESLGINCVFLDPSDNPPAGSVGPVIQRPYGDTEALRELASRVDVISYEFENVAVSALRSIEDVIDIFPPIAALRYAQDRLIEKQLFQSLDIPVVSFRTVDSESDLRIAADEIGFPIVLKTRRLGYDGKGQVVIHDYEELAHAWHLLGAAPLIAEEMIKFDREVSAIGTRNREGEFVTYPLTENVHDSGILRTSKSAAGSPALDQLAQRYHAALATHLDYVGTLALELFVVGDTILANEFAPRVHNSGHWTIEGSTSSQFENHMRAVTNMPLGDTSDSGFAAMVNIIGSMPPELEALRKSGFHVHDYGKAERPGRKLGHITCVSQSAIGRDKQLEEILRIMSN